MKRELIFTISVVIIILLINNISALSLKLMPSTLYLNGEQNKEICEKLTIEYSIVNGLVEGRDLWAEKNLNTKDLHAHNLSMEDAGLTITYPKSVRINGQKDVDICVNAQSAGLYHGALFYKTITTTGNTGIELNIWIIANITSLAETNSVVQNSSNQSISEKSSSHASNKHSTAILPNLENYSSNENTNSKVSGEIILNSKEKNFQMNLFIPLTIFLLMLLILTVEILYTKKKRKNE
jgi:hypothetical protein